MRGATSPVKSSALVVVVNQEWTVWPLLFSPEKRVKSVSPILTWGSVSFSTPNGLIEAPRGNGSPNAPIQIIISYLANEASAEVFASGSTNISKTTFARVAPSTGVMVQVNWRSRDDTFASGIGSNWALFN